MKNYKKGILTLTVLTAMSLIAAEQDKTIYVTTFADEDGENQSRCSLREAITASSLRKAYGGCPKGQQDATLTDIIQLEKGEYILNKELQPNSPVSILGKAPEDFARKDAITDEFPALITVQTTISGQGKSRIFNTANLNKPNLTLQNLILKDAKSSGVGGALLVGGQTELNNVSITNSKAMSGGAIFLNDVNSTLTITGGEFSRNDATSGSILAMSCSGNLGYTPHTIDLNTSTYIDNGSTTSQSIFDFCGQATAGFNSNTITLNTLNKASGSVIKFYAPPFPQQIFSSGSSLTLLSNTIVKNSAQSILAYNNSGVKNLNFNIIGFNDAKACKYIGGDVAGQQTAGIAVMSNALNLVNEAEKCELPNNILENAKLNTVELNGQLFDNLLETMQLPDENTKFMSVYNPKDNGTNKDFVDVESIGCHTVDQRRITRISTNNNQASNINTCDIGAIERLKLTADNVSQTNISLTTLLDRYKSIADDNKRFLDDKTTDQALIPSLRINYEQALNLKNQTEKLKLYRPIFFDPFSQNLPHEYIDGNGVRAIAHLNKENYDVKVMNKGVGKIGTDGEFIGIPDSNLKCEWKQDLGKIVMYRTDDRLTPLGDKEICEYTLTLNKPPRITANAYISGEFVNIPPVVPENTNIVVEYASNEKINLDLLKLANDAGDGPVSGLENKPNKSAFYLNEKGQTQAIRFTSIPSTVSIQAERKGPCPGLDRTSVCYGGKITAQLNNSLDVFSYKLTYNVYDVDGIISNNGFVNLNNTATAPDSVRVSGGGSMGWFSLIAFIGLGLMRKRTYKLKN